MAGNRLREHRASQLLTQRALAKAAGVDASTVVRAERGETLNILTQERLARALRLPRKDVFPDPEEAVSA